MASESINQDKNYYAIIPAKVRYDKDLPPNAKLMYGEIYALSNGRGYCWASNTYFAELYEVHKNTISIWINKLINKGYISTEYSYLEGTKYIKERHLKTLIDINENIDINKNVDMSKNNMEYQQKNKNKQKKTYQQKQGYQENRLGDINENSEDNTILNINKDIYSQIINYLNEKCKTSYRATTEKTKTLINSRMNEKFILEDFKKVIDVKASEWNGTDMAKYLRPETLFGTKFESYLNQVPQHQEQPTDKNKSFDIDAYYKSLGITTD